MVVLGKSKRRTLQQKETNRKTKTGKETVMKEASEIKKQFTERTLKLVTSGFSLVAALAWNEVIKETVNIYIKPFFGEGSGLISLFIYALIVTALVVFISYQLSKFGADEKGE
jgi:hypothetical protein